MATKKNTAKTCEIRGVEFHVDMSVFDDLDILDMVDDIMGGNPFKLKKLIAAIFRDEADKAFDLMRGEDGRIKASDSDTFMAEIFEAIGSTAKN